MQITNLFAKDNNAEVIIMIFVQTVKRKFVYIKVSVIGALAGI